MNYLVIYPGRFHPFHQGHKASYDYLVKKYGPNSVYIVTSDVQAPITSPFSFSDKVQMMTKLGVPSSHVVKVRNPYQAKEITDNLTNDQKQETVMIFAVSEKDMLEGSARFQFGAKKNGEPSYLQPMPENPKQMKPMNKHAYVAVTPTVNFRVQGKDANSASQIRQLYQKSDAINRDKIITDLYGAPDADLQSTFDTKLGITEKVQEFVYGTPIVDGGIKDPGVREHRQRISKLLEQVICLERRVSEIYDPEDTSGAVAMDPESYKSMRAKQHAWATAPASKSPTAKFTYQGFVIQFHPDRVEIFHGGDLVYKKDGNYAHPTKQQLNLVKGRIPNLVSKLKKMLENDSDDYIEEKWSQKYKSSINCSNPKGFSQRAHCAGRKKK
jgi:hypothetical protein